MESGCWRRPQRCKRVVVGCRAQRASEPSSNVVLDSEAIGQRGESTAVVSDYFDTVDGEPIDFSTHTYGGRGTLHDGEASSTTRGVAPKPARLQRCSGARRNSTCGCPAATRPEASWNNCASSPGPRPSPPSCPLEIATAGREIAWSPPTWTRRIPSSVFLRIRPRRGTT